MPTPGAPSASQNDMQTNSFLDNGDGTFQRRVSSTDVSAVNQWESVNATGSLTSPASNAQIAAVNVPSTGFYQVEVMWGCSTAETTTPDNFRMYQNTTTLFNLASGINSTQILGPFTFRKKFSAGDVAKISTDGSAGSAGSVYVATISITRLS